MPDKSNITCEDIDKKLKSFLEDLLVEEEYQALLSHIEGCERCKSYVKSIGSLSNQLWRLGEVEVPADFISTVLFKLKNPRKSAPKPETAKENKFNAYIWAAVLIILSSAACFGVIYLKGRGPVTQGHPKPQKMVNESEDAAEDYTEEVPEKRILFSEEVQYPEGYSWQKGASGSR